MKRTEVTRISLIGAVLLCLCLSAGAQEHSVPAARETAIGSSLWLRSSNSAGLALDSLRVMSDLSLGFSFEQGGLHSVWDGDRESDVRVEAKGVAKVAGMTLYGDFSYDYMGVSGARYNASLYEPAYDQPYYVADYSVSDWKKQAYDMGFRGATPLFWTNRASFGFEARYKAMAGAKQTDPRTETFRYDMFLAPSFTFSFGRAGTVGLKLEYMHGFERSTPSVENDWVTPRVAIMRGLGFYTAGTAGGNLGFDTFYYKTDRYGGSLQYYLNSVSADMLVDVGTYLSTTLVSENPQFPRMRGRTEKYGLTLDFMANLGRRRNHRVMLRADWGSTSGYEYNQQLSTSQGVSHWITINNPLMSTYDILEADMWYVWYSGFDRRGEYDYKLGVSADIFMMMQKYVSPFSRFEAANAAVHAFAGWNVPVGADSRLLPEVRAGYRISPSGEYSYGGTANRDSEIVLDMYPSELRFLTSDRLETSLGLTWALGIRGRSSLCFLLHGGYDHSFGLREHRLKADFGVIYLF